MAHNACNECGCAISECECSDRLTSTTKGLDASIVYEAEEVTENPNNERRSL